VYLTTLAAVWQKMLRAICEAINIDFAMLASLLGSMPEDGMGGVRNLASLRDSATRETCECQPFYLTAVAEQRRCGFQIRTPCTGSCASTGPTGGR